MKKHNSLTSFSISSGRRSPNWIAGKPNLIWTIALVLAVLVAPFAIAGQDIKYSPLRVSNISVQTSGGNTIVSVSADGSLRRAQTWQDNDGYHVVVPYATAAGSFKSLSGIKVRRLGQSLEILLQVETGTGVSAYLDDNRLRLFVGGELEPRVETAIDTSRIGSDENSSQSQQSSNPSDSSRSPEDSSFTSQFSNQPSSGTSTKAGPPALQPRPDLRVSQTQGSEPVAPTSNIVLQQPEESGFFGMLFSPLGVLVILGLGVVGLIVSRRLRSRQLSPKKKPVERNVSEDEEGQMEPPTTAVQPPPQRRLPAKREPVQAATTRPSGAHFPVATPESLYGAYRIDQEVGKLVLGQPHRMDVLSSRAPEDRRAIEASLIKMIVSCSDENERRRAAEALEEYGFVARECAALLMAPDPFDRTNAARSLGEMKSAAALPFLLEGLYDSESIVRNQSVASLGELKIPRAIGALLDMARRHPDVPGTLVSKALNACSVDGLDFFDAAIDEPALLGDGSSQGLGFDIDKLEPAAPVEDLQEDSDDEFFAAALQAINSEDIGERLEAAKVLSRFQVRQAVAALTDAARSDSEATVRSQAITSLAAINHESVFPAVLIGMADESREVRAAAARSLTHLNFERTDAFVRVLEMNDEELLPEVARACIQAGIVSQAIDRLATGDRRQAYETFSIISLLARAGETEPVLDAINHHQNLDVRLATVRLLTNTGEPEIFEHFRKMAVQEGLPEELRTALLEAMYQLDHSSAQSQATEHYRSAFESETFVDAPDSYGEIAITEESSTTFPGPDAEFQS